MVDSVLMNNVGDCYQWQCRRSCRSMTVLGRPAVRPPCPPGWGYYSPAQPYSRGTGSNNKHATCHLIILWCDQRVQNYFFLLMAKWQCLLQCCECEMIYSKFGSNSYFLRVPDPDPRKSSGFDPTCFFKHVKICKKKCLLLYRYQSKIITNQLLSL